MNLIAAVDQNWAIGNQNKLLVQIPEDQRFFRRMTLGHVVVMGRKTLESFPGGRPLKDRINIVLTTDPNYQVPDCKIVHSLEELWEELKQYRSEEVFVIGGEKVYRQLLEHCDRAYITKIDKCFEADTWFPNLDESGEWIRLSDPEPEEKTYFDLIYHFLIYNRKGK